jgi:FKBP-type peptidyl-prolyl cis-trans isomerase FklB
MKSTWIQALILGSITSVAGMQIAHAATGMATPSTTQQDSAKNSGEIFMEKNKKEAGVVTLPSGLQYKILEEGKGKKPSKNDSVTVDYEGTLVNDKVFDSSYKRGQPATFPVSGVIAGWQEALQLMPVGSTWRLYIPANLAYGEAGAGGLIGPNEALIFKVHLISIN